MLRGVVLQTERCDALIVRIVKVEVHEPDFITVRNPDSSFEGTFRRSRWTFNRAHFRTRSDHFAKVVRVRDEAGLVGLLQGIVDALIACRCAVEPGIADAAVERLWK